MSILYENEYGYFISHEVYINKLYSGMQRPLQINPKLFAINRPYKSLKDQSKLKRKCEVLRDQTENKDALEAAKEIYDRSGISPVDDFNGANIGRATIKNVYGYNFVFPQNSIFFCKDVSDMKTHLKDNKYDLILLDPPWWNKYIRRKRKKLGDGVAYKMLFNDDVKSLPVETLLKGNGMVVIWCTNSQQHMHDLLTEILPKWGVKYLGTWYWIKITLTGETVCTFSLPPGKQPYEQIIFGCRASCPIKFDTKLIVSIPSAVHSHKPPLVELLKQFLPENPSCLEVFARYLLPNWTSYGNEVLRLQHESLFIDAQNNNGV
ncbi:hypothetical protein NQ315_009521 [Exocentrus adspersus]|uniref:Methyltransferase-like protein 4 n=1 Tax=Exocentrus adspersus TaxID=1586481 RepID=A0AAV8WFZ9_9CUCU|nr:hypothetical protein NQ315_009521 [Exocentrus adspersus]